MPLDQKRLRHELLKVITDYRNVLLDEYRYQCCSETEDPEHPVKLDAIHPQARTITQPDSSQSQANLFHSNQTVKQQPQGDTSYMKFIDPAKNFEENYQYLVEIASQCEKCPLCGTRNSVVVGDGNIQSPVVIIGEAPGAEEDKQGIPFVGRAGQLLDKLLAGIKVRRSDVYICNVIKCRPPGNRDPLPAEVEACHPYLLAQLEIIQPRVLLTLGNWATKFILQTTRGITSLRGKVVNYKNDMLVLPTFHPSALLRQPSLKADSINDFRLLKELIQQVK